MILTSISYLLFLIFFVGSIVNATSKNNWDPTKVKYPQAHRDKTAFTYGSLLPNGTIVNVTVGDPYHWLEKSVSESNQTKAYVDAEMKLTQSYLNKSKDFNAIHSSIKHFNDYVSIDAIHRFGIKNVNEKYLYQVYLINASRPVWYLATLSEMEKGFQNQLSPFPGKLWFDENLLSDDGSKAVTDFIPSPDGKLIAYSIVTGGGDISTIYIRKTSSPFIKKHSTLEGGQGRLPESIANYTKQGISWLKDSSGFIYATESRSEDATGGYGSKVYHHIIGQSSDKDKLILDQPKDNQLTWGIGISNDFKWLLANLGGSVDFHTSSYITSLEDQQLSGDMKWISILPKPSAIMYYISNFDSTFYFLSDYDNSTNGKVISVEVDKSKAKQVKYLTDLTDTLPVKTVIPERQSAQIDYYDLFEYGVIPIFDNDKILLWYSGNASNLIFIHNLKTGELIDQVLPPKGLDTVLNIWTDLFSNEIFVETTSLNKPGSAYRVSIDKNTQKLETKLIFDSTVSGFDLNNIIHERHYSTSKDGTKIPFDLFYKKGCKFDGSMPAFVYFYGAYGINSLPVYAPRFMDFIFGYEGAAIFAYPR